MKTIDEIKNSYTYKLGMVKYLERKVKQLKIERYIESDQEEIKRIDAAIKQLDSAAWSIVVDTGRMMYQRRYENQGISIKRV